MERPPKPHTLRCGRRREPTQRWQMLFKGTWDRAEHISVLETRCLSLLARHLGRTKASWHQKYLVLSDSMAAGGAASKGRSGVFPILMQRRQLLVARVVWGVQLVIRWVPSAFNNGDWPSRGGPVGVHPDTLKEHTDQLHPD